MFSEGSICSNCAASRCCFELESCTDNYDCTDQLQCNYDGYSADSCADAYPEGSWDLESLAICLDNECYAECG